ncbi:hypothetical protein AXF42_Ash013188 [Apostasia shenzhenica]|uniref:Uncharacterized protein n=1 Tax=Apostasia shenzhenica TaxID=1088818 RepID=A0A2I0BD98_9ASPA|nr:hypothetical protein AXF42_Ash013188 [Apostasia shenzhenica]
MRGSSERETLRLSTVDVSGHCDRREIGQKRPQLFDVASSYFGHPSGSGGRFNGEAFCVLAYPLQVDFAFQRNRQNMGRRYIEVFKRIRLWAWIFRLWHSRFGLSSWNFWPWDFGFALGPLGFGLDVKPSRFGDSSQKLSVLGLRSSELELLDFWHGASAFML